MEKDAFTIYTIVSAVMRRGDEILLVHQYRPQDPHPNWFLPGGRVEPGELLSEGLVREVREETGLEVVEVGAVACLTQAFDAGAGAQSLAFVFEVTGWRGMPQAADPDGVVSEARFYPLDQALALLAKVPWHSMREPVTAYLLGTQPVGTVWMYANRGEIGQPYATLAGILPGRVEGLRDGQRETD